ncbi:reprolysin-like metallopeptidase [Microbulbifer epialgicus]|uniref:Reprolysin-like metallopeptidase n=1 Tax=Microbulbifer epialgicus TaxID=393907 RepID=A0ABV4NVV5_9GAMM
MSLKYYCAFAVAALNLSSVVSAETIGITMLYTQPAAQHTGDISVKIDSLISEANRIYENNDVDIQLELVDSRQFSDLNMTVTGESLAEVAGVNAYIESEAGIPTWDKFLAWGGWSEEKERESKGADMVALLGMGEPAFENGERVGTYCGIAYLGEGANGVMDQMSKRRAYSVTAVDCSGGALTFVHELGHNMGLSHSPRQPGQPGVYSYGWGHGVDDNFSTIMAYPHYYGDAIRLDMFSNPGKLCNSLACGVENVSDSHRAIVPIIDDMAGYY